MGILLAFAPFVAFALVDRFVGATAGLLAGAVVAVGFLVRDVLTPGRAPKILEIGTVILFCGLALYAVTSGVALSVIGVRLLVDAGLLAIVLGTLAVGQPFTAQYARQEVPAELWNTPEFMRTNYIITGVWALAFAVMVIAELALLYIPGLPQRLGIIIIIAALYGAVKFTGWYPKRVEATRAP